MDVFFFVNWFTKIIQIQQEVNFFLFTVLPYRGKKVGENFRRGKI